MHICVSSDEKVSGYEKLDTITFLDDKVYVANVNTMIKTEYHHTVLK
jgi:hypothetical protein